MATAKPTANLSLIRRCHETAKSQLDAKESVSFRNRLTNQNNEFLMNEIQTEFQAEAYIAYLVGKLGLIEFKACLFFESIANQNLLFSMIETQPDHVTLTNLKNMTKQKLTDKLLNNIAEFVNEYRGRKKRTSRVH